MNSKKLVSILIVILICCTLSFIFSDTEQIYTNEPINIINDTEDIIPLTFQELHFVIEYPERWTCFDIAMNWSEQHPEWGMVLISKNPRFEGYKFGDNHLVNYKLLPDKSLLIHDGTRKINTEYIISGWEYDSCTFEYYHFYINGEMPTRTWTANALHPNAEVVYNSLSAL